MFLHLSDSVYRGGSRPRPGGVSDREGGVQAQAWGRGVQAQAWGGLYPTMH